MRLPALLIAFTIPVASAAQDKVSYRNVELPGRAESGTAIEFTLALPDSLAAARVRAAGERRKLNFGRAETAMMSFGKTLPGVCDGSKGVFLLPGQRTPTGPCHLTFQVTWSPAPAGGTTFRVSAVGYLEMSGSDVVTDGGFTPRSSHWNLVRQLAREIAEAKD